MWQERDEKRGGFPATVKRTEHEHKPGILRIDFPGFSGEDNLERVDWDARDWAPVYVAPHTRWHDAGRADHHMTSTELSNHSSPHKRARLKVKLAAGFRENVELIQATLLSVAQSHPEVLPEPPPVVRFEAILDSHFVFALIVWVEEPVTTLRVASELRFAIVRAFAHCEIQFPMPELVRDSDQREWVA